MTVREQAERVMKAAFAVQVLRPRLEHAAFNDEDDGWMFLSKINEFVLDRREIGLSRHSWCVQASNRAKKVLAQNQLAC